LSPKHDQSESARCDQFTSVCSGLSEAASLDAWCVTPAGPSSVLAEAFLASDGNAAMLVRGVLVLETA
ncbi:hypothetical protein, partial [Brevundimonas sp.]|uniref:hypothetical protein n=1 Tax=Brevundimonas sp. TaxID=1871086 RepID=UPI0028A9D251